MRPEQQAGGAAVRVLVLFDLSTWTILLIEATGVPISYCPEFKLVAEKGSP